MSLLYDKAYFFTGKHGMMVNALTSPLSEDCNFKIFNYIYEIFWTAPLIGFMNKRRAVRDLSDQTTNPPRIHAEQFITYDEKITQTFQLIMLLDSGFAPDSQARIEKLFKSETYSSEDKERFEEYLRGGIEYLYESLIKDAIKPEDYLHKMWSLISDIAAISPTSVEIVNACDEILHPRNSDK